MKRRGAPVASLVPAFSVELTRATVAEPFYRLTRALRAEATPGAR